MSEFKGTLSEECPMIMQPAREVLSLVAWDNTTIDMTFEQARKIATKIIQILGEDV